MTTRKLRLGMGFVFLTLLSFHLQAATLLVWPDSPAPATPYDVRTNATQTGDTVLVTNGVYATGGRVDFKTVKK